MHPRTEAHWKPAMQEGERKQEEKTGTGEKGRTHRGKNMRKREEQQENI